MHGRYRENEGNPAKSMVDAGLDPSNSVSVLQIQSTIQSNPQTGQMRGKIFRPKKHDHGGYGPNFNTYLNPQNRHFAGVLAAILFGKIPGYGIRGNFHEIE